MFIEVTLWKKCEPSEESTGKFKDIADRTVNKTEKSRALHNMGNSLLMNNKLDESIDAYKEALRNNPGDLETKYNLLYAMNLKKKQEEQKKKEEQNKDKNKDQDKNLGHHGAGKRFEKFIHLT